MGFALSGGALVDQLALPAHGVADLAVLAGLANAAGNAFGFWILTARQAEFVAQTKMHLKGWREIAWIGVVAFFGCGLPVGAAGVLVIVLRMFASASVVGLVVQVVVWLLLVGLAWWLIHLDARASLGASASAAAAGDQLDDVVVGDSNVDPATSSVDAEPALAADLTGVGSLEHTPPQVGHGFIFCVSGV